MTAATTRPGVCFLFHGESKAGKTWLGASGPEPVLILDAEGGTRFLPAGTIQWDGISEPPVPDGSWKVCVVPVRNFETMSSVYQWLNMGKHSFNTVVIDSISETQQRLVDSLVGSNPMGQQQWGELLRRMSVMVRMFRDLTTHPTHPIQAVVLIAMTKEVNARRVPFVQGQLATALPYYIDVVGYLFIHVGEDGTPVRRLYLQAHPLFEAGDRTGRLGAFIDDPTLTTMLDMIHTKES